MKPFPAIVAVLLWSVQAAVPAELQVRATCNRDNCFREVFGTNIAGRSSQGAADCTSYLQRTVSPCTTTLTSITTSFKTVTTKTFTSTVSTTLTKSATAAPVTQSITTTVTTSTTITPTTTQTSTVSTTVATETDTQTDTATTTTTVTVTSTSNTPQKRATTTACPATISASEIPAYASDCTGSRFLSVCSCNGNIPTSTVLSTPTSTVTVTKTSSVSASTTTTSVSTITQTITASPTVTVSGTMTTTATLTAPTMTTVLTITSSITATTTTTTTTTTTATSTQTVAPTCTQGKIFPGTSSTCLYQQYCEQTFQGVSYGTPITVTDETGCLSACDSYNKYQSVHCYGYSFNYITGYCQFFAYEQEIVDAPGVRSAYFYYCNAPS